MNGLYSLYETLYFKSLEERDRVISRIQVNVTLFTAFSVAIFYMFKSMDYNETEIPIIICIVALICTFLSILASAYYTYKVLKNKNDYLKISECSSLTQYREGMSQYIAKLELKNLNSEEKIVLPDLSLEVKKNLCKQMSECIDKNNAINEKKNVIDK
ncbi:hypothetical protein [Proteus sp. G2660]|uniref:hypothetical protein n=1 Tax=Proteus sp. G2660 TaxID=2698873 RepID=UPI0013774CEA|nr:hypothetical protein [Proteus sp. G2660]NBM97231.1 hypothetical protein [Proteus sp. G2660]